MNIQLILAAICVIAGIVILWRTFFQPAQPPVTLAPTAEQELPTEEAPINTMVPTVTADPALLPTSTPQPQPEGYPAPVQPTAAVPTIMQPTAVVAPTVIAPTAAGAGAVTPPPTSLPAQPTAALPSPVVPTSQLPPTAVIVATQTVPPTAIATPTLTPTPTVVTPTPTAPNQAENPTPTHTPTQPVDTPTATMTATATATPQGNTVTVVYRLEGNASRVSISYIDGTGVDRDVEAPLPWTLQFATKVDADLAVEAYSSNDEELYLKCSIEISGTVVNFDETQNAIDGVVCNRFMP